MAPSAGMCELMRALQSTDNTVRGEAEKKLMEAVQGAPNELVLELLAVLAASEEAAATDLRQEAVVVLRQCASEHGSKSCWKNLEKGTQEALKEQVLASLTKDPSALVRRNAGSVVQVVASSIATDYQQLLKEWPRLLHFLSETISAGQPTQVTACLKVLVELVDLVGEALLAQGPQTVTLLQTCLQSAPGEVRAAAVQLMFQMVEELEVEHLAPLGPLMPTVIEVIKGFAVASEHEESLKETLESLISAAEEEPAFFKENGLQQLWPLLMEMCKADHWADAAVRHSAMEAVMTIFEELCEDFCKPEGMPFLEQLITLNIQWMLEVEENVELWTSKVDEEDDDLDEDIVDIGEENLDRMAEHCAEKDVLEDAFMPALFKVMRLALAQSSGWKETRACAMAVSQVAEYIEEEAWVDQCLDFLGPHVGHAHPRVRFSAFQALGQTAYDHDTYVAENHTATLLPMFLAGLDDSNLRVAANAASALSSMEDMDSDDLEPHLEALMTRLLARLQRGESQNMQEYCLAAIAVVGEAAGELFEPYYSHVLPVLKQLIASSSSEKQRKLRGKAFECASLLGENVGKEFFAKDAHEIMQVMVGYFQQGFAADDETREYIHEAAGRVATVLGKDFKPYMPALLPSLFAVLDQTPKEMTLEEPEDEMTHELVDGKLMGLKTSALEEMTDTLQLISSLVEALEEDFVDFMSETCRRLMPLLDFALSSEFDVKEKAHSAWESVVQCARRAADQGRCDPSLVGQVTGELLKKTVAMMTKQPPDAENPSTLTQLQTQAQATAKVITKAGQKVLAKKDVADLVQVLIELLGRVKVAQESAEMAPKKKGHAKTKDSDSEDDSDSDEGSVSGQSVRFALADVAAALIKMSKEEFVEVGLQLWMEPVKALLQQGEADRSLALYMIADVVEGLGELSVPYWNSFMEIACNCITDKSPVIRQHAATVAGHAAAVPIFAQIAPMAASQLARVLQKHGERHRRRRALNAEAKQVAMGVDASIWALGMICEHQERQVGGDSTGAWKMWLSHMPPRCDRDLGSKACSQLLQLVLKNHQVVTAPEQQPRVLTILADAYKSRNSSAALDKEIVSFVAAGAGSVQSLQAQLGERQQKKLDMILKDAEKEKNKSQEGMLPA